MNKEPFVIERILQAPVEKVWHALTDADAMRKWYFDLPGFKAEPGFEFSFKGGPDDGVQYNHLCKVTAVVPQKKLAYSWCYENYEGYSEVTFELFAEGDKTKLVLTHKGLESFPAGNSDFKRESFEAGWTYIIGTSLLQFVEKE